MLDLKFDHGKDDVIESLGVKVSDLKKFLIDVEDYMAGVKSQQHSRALEFVWASEQSFEMKIAVTFCLGGMSVARPNINMIMGSVPPELKDIIKKIVEGDV